MEKKYRFLLIQAFTLPSRPHGLSKEKMIMNYNNVKHLLEDVDWDYSQGPLAPYGDWAVETREEFCLVAPGRCQIVREACKSGKYNALILLGGGEPGFFPHHLLLFWPVREAGELPAPLCFLPGKPEARPRTEFYGPEWSWWSCRESR